MPIRSCRKRCTPSAGTRRHCHGRAVPAIARPASPDRRCRGLQGPAHQPPDPTYPGHRRRPAGHASQRHSAQGCGRRPAHPPTPDLAAPDQLQGAAGKGRVQRCTRQPHRAFRRDRTTRCGADPQGRQLYDRLLDATREALAAHRPKPTPNATWRCSRRSSPNSRTTGADARTGAGVLPLLCHRKGLAARDQQGRPTTLQGLIDAGHVHFEALVYEDFLPVSAAGIFQSTWATMPRPSTAATPTARHSKRHCR